MSFVENKPKKSLGQNFLIDNNIINKIVGSFETDPGDTIVEIGPGEGSLTLKLVQLPISLIAVEIDTRAVETLKKKIGLADNFTIIEKDILEVELGELLNHYNITKKIKVIGNIPYYITSDIFFWIVENYKYISKVQLMMQKEVASRFIAKPRTKDYGILTIAANFISSSKVLFDVSANCFYPVPNVTSSVIQYQINEDIIKNRDIKELMQLVRASFSQRRKTLKNSLSAYLSKINIIAPDELISEYNTLKDCNFFGKRAEELTVTDYLDLYDFIDESRNKK